MANGWTPERRARQAALIRSWRPWEQSTGPKSPDGRAQAAANARRFHGWTPELAARRERFREMRREMADLLARQRDLLARRSE